MPSRSIAIFAETLLCNSRCVNQGESKMKRVFSICLIAALTCILGSKNTQATEEKIVSPNSKVQYLGVDGTFTIDTTEIAAKDPRNPKRVVFKQMETFSFYQDLEGKTSLAQNCRYSYKGAAGDPFYYPEKSKTSVWDLFELVSGDTACNQFKYVAMRSPHGNPVHMHMRYGDTNSSFEKLLAMSNAPEDKTKIDPWWSVYCAEGESGCDK